MYRVVHIDTLTLAGASGTQTSTLRITGKIVGVVLKMVGQTSPVFSLTTVGTLNAPSFTIIGFTANVSGYLAVRAKPVDNTNTAIAGAFTEFVVDDQLVLGVASGGAVGTIDAWIIYDDYQVKISG